MSGKGYVVKAMTVTIDTVDYACEVTQVALTPNAPTQTTHTACPDGTVSDIGPADWTVDVTFNNDTAAASLLRLLMLPANYGKAAVVTFAPDETNAPTFGYTIPVRLVPPAATFPVGDWATSTVSLPATGSPAETVLTAAVEADQLADVV